MGSGTPAGGIASTSRQLRATDLGFEELHLDFIGDAVSVGVCSHHVFDLVDADALGAHDFAILVCNEVVVVHIGESKDAADSSLVETETSLAPFST
jgi:hypothetical protein